MMRTLNLLSLFFVIFLMSCSAGVEVITKDLNGDEKVDLWVYKKDGVIIKTERDDNSDGKPDKQYYWDDKGRLIKTKTLKKSIRPIHYYGNYQKLYVDELEVWKNEMDLKKTYPNKFVRNAAVGFSYYTSNSEPVYTEIDKNRDGSIDQTIVIKDYKRVDEHNGPLTDIRNIRL